MSALTQAGSSPSTLISDHSSLPDYLPARMINEYVYCPRLFYYEQVEGVFVESADTIEGKAQHKRVDKEGKGAPPPEEETEEPKVARSITLSSDEHRVIAKLDLAEFGDGKATPVDYKHGRPYSTNDGIEPWPSDRVQLAVQGLVLRANGYTCEEGIVYYRQTKQRVRVTFDEAVIREALEAIEGAWQTAAAPEIPPPLIDSPKCPGCSLAGICMPDETWGLTTSGLGEAGWQLDLFGGRRAEAVRPPDSPRLMVTPRTDRRPLYLNTQGLRVGKSGGVIQVREGRKLVQEARLTDLCQVNLMGNIQMSTQAVQTLCNSEIPICYFSQGGWFYGVTTGLNTKNVFLRKAQFHLADEDWFCLRLARKLVAGKIQNQRTMVMRNHVEPPAPALREMKVLGGEAEGAESLEELLGYEGAAARLYFGCFSGMIKRDDDGNGPGEVGVFDFSVRNRRPPRDAVNALLSLGYSLLAKDLTVSCYAVGFDPMVGFYHQPRHGRPALALDLMEPMRPLITDSAVLTAINTRMLSPRHIVRAGKSVSLTPDGRKAFFRAYEMRMDTLVTHPLFDYRVSYRRLLEIQTRLLAKTLESNLAEYPVFVTR